PQRQYEVRRPDGDTRHKTPEDVARQRFAEQEQIALLLRPASVVLELSALQPASVKNVVPRAVDPDGEGLIAGKKQRDPADGEASQVAVRRLEEFPKADGDPRINGKPGEEQSRKTEQILEQFYRLR